MNSVVLSGLKLMADTSGRLMLLCASGALTPVQIKMTTEPHQSYVLIALIRAILSSCDDTPCFHTVRRNSGRSDTAAAYCPSWLSAICWYRTHFELGPGNISVIVHLRSCVRDAHGMLHTTAPVSTATTSIVGLRFPTLAPIQPSSGTTHVAPMGPDTPGTYCERDETQGGGVEMHAPSHGRSHQQAEESVRRRQARALLRRA